MPIPELTVAVAVGAQRERATNALASILKQDSIDRIEVLLLDFGKDLPRLPGADHPMVRTLLMAPFATLSSAREEAVRAARAGVIAFLEEHALAKPGWATALVNAHRGPFAAVGGGVHNGNPESLISRVTMLMNYLPFLPPSKPHEARYLPGNNSSFKRDLLLSYGPELRDLLAVEMALYERLVRDGHRLFSSPDAQWEHLQQTTLSDTARAHYLYHRMYGPVRARAFGWTRARRLVYVLATPAIPFVYVVRLLASVARTRRDLLGLALRGIPIVFFAQLATAIGQMAGLLWGAEGIERQFTDFELTAKRPHDIADKAGAIRAWPIPEGLRP